MTSFLTLEEILGLRRVMGGRKRYGDGVELGWMKKDYLIKNQINVIYLLLKIKYIYIYFQIYQREGIILFYININLKLQLICYFCDIAIIKDKNNINYIIKNWIIQ